MGSGSLIKLKDAQCLSDGLNRLKCWIILTDEYGKPSEKYLDSFIYNFGTIISNGTLYNKLQYHKSSFDEIFNKPEYRFTGGLEFYEYLRNLQGESNDKIKDAIKNWNPVGVDELGVNSLEDKLIYPITLEFSGTLRGGWHGVVRYDADNKKSILLKGSKIANEPSRSCRPGIMSDLNEYKSRGVISSDNILMNDIEFNSITGAMGFSALCSYGFDRFMVYGFDYKLDDLFNDIELYKKISSSERNIFKSHNPSEMAARSQVRPNEILSANKHNLKIDIVGDKHGRYSAIALYSYKHNKWALLSGKICSKKSTSTGSQIIEADNRLNGEIKLGNIDSNYNIVNPIVFNSYTDVVYFVRRYGGIWGDTYIHGTKVELRQVFKNKLLYRKYIIMNQENW